jgi:hypothetical protein
MRRVDPARRRGAVRPLRFVAALLIGWPATFAFTAVPAGQPAGPAASNPVSIAASAALLAPFLDMEWRDQQGGRDRLASHMGQRVVLIVVEARRLPLAGRWAEALQARDPELMVLTVADAPLDVPVDPVRFAATLRRRVPAGVRVWLDPERRLATALSLATAEPNLLLIAPGGALAAQFRGRADEARIAAVMAAAAALPVGVP